MKPKAEKIVYDRETGTYTVTFDDGNIIACNELRSTGKKRDDGHYDHVLKYSDGETIPFVGSQETVIIPDISWM